MATPPTTENNSPGIIASKIQVLTRAMEVVKRSRENDQGPISADKIIEVYNKFWAVVSED